MPFWFSLFDEVFGAQYDPRSDLAKLIAGFNGEHVGCARSSTENLDVRLNIFRKELLCIMSNEQRFERCLPMWYWILLYATWNAVMNSKMWFEIRGFRGRI